MTNAEVEFSDEGRWPRYISYPVITFLAIGCWGITVGLIWVLWLISN